MKFSYSAVWSDTVRMFGANASLLLAIAGVFFFLPALLVGYLLPPPAGATTTEAMIVDLSAYLEANWHWLLLANVVNMVGAIAIYLLLFNTRNHTVGGAIAGAIPFLLFYLILSILSTLIIGAGCMLFLLPGLYLLGRLGISGAVMVAEGARNPLEALGRTWTRTKGRGWAVAGIIILIAITGFVLTFVASRVFGSVILLALGREGVGSLVLLILDSAVSAAFSSVMLVLMAAIYRALPAPAVETSGI
jgi:hypothetical protein